MTQSMESTGRPEELPEAADLSVIAQQLVDDAAERGVQLTGEGGLLTRLTRQVLQSALEAEMSAHLGYDKHDPVGRNLGDSRNGSSPKTVTTEVGKVMVDVPHDRAGTFSPAIIGKHQRRLDGFDEQVISLYAKGLTTGDIARHLQDVYGTDVSRSLVFAGDRSGPGGHAGLAVTAAGSGVSGDLD